ncbi:MAG: hypothetical protein GX354_12180 [Firmicutes bacterium]|jgi:hypothetical protein|nr:hypothetical protein [Bacillota bacterium]
MQVSSDQRESTPIGGAKANKPNGILQLARQQAHWLERFILPGLAGIFTISLLILARQYLAILVPRVFVPYWVMVVGAIASWESIYAASFHIRLRTPISLRVAEFALIIGLVYGGLRIGGVGEEGSLFSSGVWRDPEILVPLLLVAGAWSLARGYGQVFVRLGDIAREVGDQGAVTFSWETESYLSDYQMRSDRAKAVGYFTRRFLFYVTLACIFNAIIIEGFSERLLPLAGWQRVTSLATVGLLFSGLLLQASVYLYRLRVIWQEVRIPVDTGIPRDWLWSSVVFIGLVLLVAVLLPSGLSPLNFSRTMEMLAGWMARGMDFSLPPKEHSGSTTYTSPMGQMGLPETGTFSWLVAVLYFLFSLLLVVLVVGAIAALVGLVLFAFFKDEWERLHGLARIPIYIYLWFRETIGQLFALLSTGARRSRELFGRWSGAKPLSRSDDALGQRQGRASPSAPALYIRHLFTLLIEAAVGSGLVQYPTSQTPLEYSKDLGTRLGCVEEELGLLTDYYLRARYSQADFPRDSRSIVKDIWQIVITAIDTWQDKAVEEAEKDRSKSATQANDI